MKRQRGLFGIEALGLTGEPLAHYGQDLRLTKWVSSMRDLPAQDSYNVYTGRWKTQPPPHSSLRTRP